MNITKSLLLLATTVTPLFAQESPGNIFSLMAATQSSASALKMNEGYAAKVLQARAIHFSALAGVPASAESFFVVTDMQRIAQNFVKEYTEKGLPDPPPADLLEKMPPLRGLAIAGGQGSTASLELLCNLVSHVQTEMVLPQLLVGWKSIANPVHAQAIDKAMGEVMNAKREAFLKLATQNLISDSYAVLTLQDGAEATATEWAAIVQQGLNELTKNPGVSEFAEYVEVQGMAGIRVKAEAIKAMMEKEGNDLADTISKGTYEQLVTMLTQKDIYVLFKHDGLRMTMLTTTAPEQVKLPTTLEESILATDKLNFCNLRFSHELICVASVSEGIINSALYNSDLISDMGKAVSTSFKYMAEADAANSPVFLKAAAGVGSYVNLIESMYKTHGAQFATEFAVWNNFQSAEITGPAQGLSFTPGEMMALHQAADPSTIFYAETSGYTQPDYGVDAKALLHGAVALAHGIGMTLPEGMSAEISQKMKVAEVYMPDLEAYVDGLCKTCEGLSTASGIFIDNKGTLPAAITGQDAVKINIPRLSIFAGVKNRALVAEGWDKMYAATGSALARTGLDQMLQMAPITSNNVGEAASYSIAVPGFTSPDLVPNVTVSDKCFAMGSSSALNETLVNFDAENTRPLMGCVFMVRFEPMVPIAQSIADYKKTLIPAKEETPEPVVVEEEGEDYEEDYSISYSSEQYEYEEAQDIADGLKEFSKYVDGIYGVINTNNDRYSLRLDLRLKK